MKQIKITLITLFLLVGTIAKADEGMWLPFLLGRNYEDMKKHGLRLTQEELYSINQSSIKDAIISFGGFCTGEIISKQGLILTNHHCGYEAIAEASTKENNYLDDGFWAKNNAEEIPVPGLHATFIVRIEDVTQAILSELNENMTEDERNMKIRELSRVLQDKATEGTNYSASISSFFEGNEFYLFVKEKFNDIRFVGTPPQSAGKFGGDTDNWMWPRHTADFSMFRIYANKDNKPAPFSSENKPYVPKHALPISIKGVEKDDFAMILGFPGSTDRYLSSWGVEQAVTLEQPKRVDIRAKKLKIMKRYMDKDDAVRLNYSATYAQVANYWKYFIGQTEQVKNNDVVGKKQAIETEYRDYLKNIKMSHDVLGSMENYYKSTNDIVNIKVYQSEYIYTVGANVTAFRYKFWADAMIAGQEDRAKTLAGRFGQMSDDYFESADMDIELDIIHNVLHMYLNDIPESQLGPLAKKIAAKGMKGVEKYMKLIKKKSMFLNKEKFDSFNAAPSLKTMQKDPLFKLIVDINGAYEKATGTDKLKDAKDNLQKANRYFIAGLRDMNPKKMYYPNANSTLRLTYGNVLPYNPKDAVAYDFVTTIDGVMQKEDPSNPEFVVHPKIKSTWKQKDYGQYADKNGNLTVNFLSNNDITGGNSGSPVINGDGQLIGTAFDGNWEAMSGDIFFETNIQRTISLDIRYTLWLVDKVFGATNLIEEMELVK
tara:strand:+ start:47080 stop:49218 length:2139 start_codon:yes stop_codon:yes gene_type:complete